MSDYANIILVVGTVYPNAELDVDYCEGAQYLDEAKCKALEDKKFLIHYSRGHPHPTFPRIEKALRTSYSPLSTSCVPGTIFVLTNKIFGSQEWLICASFTKETVFDLQTETKASSIGSREEWGYWYDPWVKFIEWDLPFHVAPTQKNYVLGLRYCSLLKE